MSPDKTQRIALITGANRGIGFETARQLARRGFHVVIAGRDERKGRQAAEAIRVGSRKATFLSLDVSSSDSQWREYKIWKSKELAHSLLAKDRQSILPALYALLLFSRHPNRRVFVSQVSRSNLALGQHGIPIRWVRPSL